MRKHYDFSNAIKNPHAGMFKDGYTVIVEHKGYDEVITITKSRKEKNDLNEINIASENIVQATNS